MIYFAVLHLSEEVYLMPWGYTKLADLYIEVEDMDQLPEKAQVWLISNNLKTKIVQISSTPALTQDRSRYNNLIR